MPDEEKQILYIRAGKDTNRLEPKGLSLVLCLLRNSLFPLKQKRRKGNPIDFSFKMLLGEASWERMDV